VFLTYADGIICGISYVMKTKTINSLMQLQKIIIWLHIRLLAWDYVQTLTFQRCQIVVIWYHIFIVFTVAV